MIRVFQADDHSIVREGLRALLSGEPDMELVGEAADGDEAVRKILALRPDVIILDLNLPRKHGLDVIREVKAAFPEARILVISSFGDDAHVFPALRAGAQGFLLKDALPADLLRAVRDVSAGQSALHPAVALRVLQELKRGREEQAQPAEPLTQREQDILRLVAHGLSNQEIAARLVVSERTVRTHMSNILAKLHLVNRTQAALYALKEGIATLDDL